MKKSVRWLALWIGLVAINQARADIALKNFREIYESFLTATALVPNTNLTAAYTAVRELLPKYGNPDEYTPPMALAVFRLGATACRQFVDLEATKAASARRAHKSVDFTKGPSVLSETIRREVIANYASLFWQDAPTEKEVDIILPLMDKLGKKLGDTAAATQTILVGTCTAMATSLDFLAI